MSIDNPKCGKYELLKRHEDAGIEYQAGEVLEFNCDEAEYLQAHGVIWDMSDKPVTRKRLVPSACGGCGSHLVTDPPVTE